MFCKLEEFLNRRYFLKGKLKIAYYLLESIIQKDTREILKGYCNVCGKKTVFFGLWSPQETYFCLHCGSSSRNRALAKVFLSEFGVYENLKKFNQTGIRGYLVAAYGPIAEALKGQNFVFSEYFDNINPGEKKNGILCQDLTCLTFPDRTFDIVISEAVIEHVKDPFKSFLEVHRVLKEGGKYIFSVPFESVEKTTTRVLPNGASLLEKKYHKDPLRKSGALVYTDFSKKDFLEKMLLPAGFSGEVLVINDSEKGILNCDIFLAKKGFRNDK